MDYDEFVKEYKEAEVERKKYEKGEQLPLGTFFAYRNGVAIYSRLTEDGRVVPVEDDWNCCGGAC